MSIIWCGYTVRCVTFNGGNAAFAGEKKSSVAFDGEDSFLLQRFSLEISLRASSPCLRLNDSFCFQAALLSARDSQ